jgi:PAS domain S-box-containing protein
MFKSVAFKFFLTVSMVFGLAFFVLGVQIHWLIKSAHIERSKDVVADFIQEHAKNFLEPRSFVFTSKQEARDAFVRFFNIAQMPEIVRIKVWDKESRVIFSDEEAIVGKYFYDNSELQEALNGQIEAHVQKPTKQENAGEAQYTQLLEVYVPIYFEGDTEPRGVIETYFNLDKTNALLVQTRRSIIVIAFVTALALLFITWALFQWLINRRITKLRVVSEKIAAGDLHALVNLQGDDEIKKLADVFDAMTKKLKELYEGLEKRIAERTDELEQETKRTEREAENTKKFYEAVEAAAEHIVITDADAKIIYANKAAETTTGYSRQEIIGNRPSLWGKQMEGEFYERMWKTIKFDKKTFHGEIKNKRKNGERYFADIHVSPILDSQGNVKFFIGIERDITPEKELESARADFLSLASHQLRTPLTGTKWLIETMQQGIVGKIPKKQKEYIDQLYSINERMIKLVADMLSVLIFESGSPSMKIQRFSVSRLYDELFLMVEPAAKKKKIVLSSLCKDSGDQVLEVETDFQMLRSIVECFTSNAIDYSERGQEIKLNAQETADAVVLSVQDNGIGIPKKEQSRIFERFYRTSNAKGFKPEGTGLGLYIAALLAQKLGVRVSFESKEGSGSTFYVHVPKKVVLSNDRNK